MRRSSIRLRLLAAAVIAVGIALVLAELGLTYLFERNVERAIDADIAVHLNQVIAAITIDGGKPVVRRPPSDPRFEQPLSGLYWQIEATDGSALLTSRSLWDARIDLGLDHNEAGDAQLREITGPEHSSLRAAMRTVAIATPQGDKTFRVAVAIDHREISAASRGFAFDLVPAMAILALLLIAALWVQVTVGLAPFDRLRTAVSDIVSGDARRLAVDVPREVRPLADEINRLLEAQEQALAKARSRAADLAHGLKTPLQVLAGDIRTLRTRGDTELAEEIEAVASTLRRHVDREMARARIAASRGRDANLRDVAVRVVNVLRRTPRGRDLQFAIDAADDMTVHMDEADLAEIIGNLAENACRFARGKVIISGKIGSAAVEVNVSDDGPGIPEAQREHALARGTSLDTRSGGSGLGLAIVTDSAEAYGGSLRLEDAGPGLRAVVTIPQRERAKALSPADQTDSLRSRILPGERSKIGA